MTETEEYDTYEQSLRYAEIRAGARYFADMAQFLQASLSWNADRVGDLYPVMMRALDAIEEAREASEEAAKALDERADTLIQEIRERNRPDDTEV